MVKQEVMEFMNALQKAREDPSPDNILALISSLAPFSPPGLEWGIELVTLAGITYMLEDGRLIAVRVSRDEFGPFMQTSIAETSLEAIPQHALNQIRDNIDGFIERVITHLRAWLERAPPNHPKLELVTELIQIFG